MQTLTTQTTIEADGTVNIRVPSNLPPGPAEVVVVVQPLLSSTSNDRKSPYPSDRGVWRGKLPDTDLDADLREMNQLWHASLEADQ